MSKHTPPPWKYSDNGSREVIPLRDPETKVATISVRDTKEEEEANASIITAAPETAAERDRIKALNVQLLDEVRRLRGLVIEYSTWGADGLMYASVIGPTNRLLAKAEGKDAE